nr:hypothetical protein [Tanacetum cinerariifolium]
KSRDELEAQQNVQKVKEHLIAEEIEKLVEGAENVEKVEVNSFTLRQDDTQTIPRNKLQPRSDQESLKVEITAEVQPVNINKEEEESTEDNFKLKQMEKGKHVNESRSTPSPIPTLSLCFPELNMFLTSASSSKLWYLSQALQEISRNAVM